MISNTDMSNASYQAALQVAQEAIAELFGGQDHLPEGCQTSESLAVKRAKALLEWDRAELGILQLLFDAVELPDKKGQNKDKKHYCQLREIEDSDTPAIPYPLTQKPTAQELQAYIEKVQNDIKEALPANWHNLSFLSLILEKYASCVSFSKENVALVDLTRITGAVAAALAQSNEPDNVKELSLVAGDLSGIQKFIYTISSEGALKSLRARSFYLELTTEEVVQELLNELQLPRSNVIYAGGGNIYIIAYTSEIRIKISRFQEQFNNWLLKQFQGKVYLAIDFLEFPIEQVNNKLFSEQWDNVIQELNKQKTRKFESHLIKSDLLKPKDRYSERCRVCHRDDTTDLDQLSEEGSVLACPTCRKMYWLGDQLFNTKFLIRSNSPKDPSDSLIINTALYRLLRSQPQQLDENETLFVINDLSLEKYQHTQTASLLLGNYGQKVKDDPSKNERFIRALEMAQRAKGINRVGYLRMDVDRLGQIFAKGLDEDYSLPRLAGLSRQMSYFFKVYLNTLAETRQLPETAQRLTDGDRPNLLFIYAGGDDLFVSGAWNEVVEFAFDVYQSFRMYTGYNPDITLSGGISIDDIKFPLYQSAESSGEAEHQAKGNGRDSLGLFGTVFKWNQWLGATEAQGVQTLINQLDGKAENHLDPKDQPEWLGILPFVRSLYKELKGNYSRSFVRNLLLTAELQEQAIKEKQEQIDKIRKNQSAIQENSDIVKLEREREEIRYYLHLPKIAYTLARLPDRLRKEDSFKPIRTSLKNPYNTPYFRAIATWIELLHRN